MATYMEIYAHWWAVDFHNAKKYNSKFYWSEVETRLSRLLEGKFMCYCRLTQAVDPGPREITTSDMIEALCKIGEMEYVAYIMQYLKEHNYVAPEEKL